MNIERIKQNLGVEFKNDELLTVAFTHSSYANSHHVRSNERLEFLGDSILNFVTTDFLIKNFSEEEGYLSKLKAYLVSADSLSEIIDKLDVIKELSHGNFNAHSSKNVMCDLFESIVGAIYLDSGVESATKFIYDKLDLETKSVLQRFNQVDDYKTKLQEIVQKDGKNTIEYVLTNKQGSGENQTYTITLKIGGEVVCTNTSKSKRQAEILCAKQACENLKK